MKLNKIFKGLIKDGIVIDCSTFKDQEKRYIIINLGDNIFISFEYLRKQRSFKLKSKNTKLTTTQLQKIKKFSEIFNNQILKNHISETDYTEYYNMLDYEKKIELLGITKKQAERVFVKGVIDIHPKLKDYVLENGYIHLSVMDLNLRRPIIFKTIRNVKFPQKFEIRGIDIVSPGNYEDRFNTDFYIDLWYGKNAEDVHKNRGELLGGESWGKSGKPSPIKIGSNVQISINKFWTPELWDGGLKRKKDEFFSCWVDLQKDKKNVISEKNNLKLKINYLDENKKEKEIAQVEKNNISIDEFPIPIHFFKKDIKDSYSKIYEKNGKIVTGHIMGELTSYDEKGNIISTLKGGRASPATQITISGFKGLKIILYKEKGL